MFVRGGRSLGSTTFFPKAPRSPNPPEVLAAFVGAVLPGARCARRNHRRERIRGHGGAGRDARGARLAQGAHRLLGARHPRALAGDDAPRMPQQALKMRGLPAPSIESSLEALRAAFGSAGGSRAHRVLRHQPHRRRRHRGLVRGVRRRGADQERLPALQHRGHPARRRLCRHASGAHAALQARARRRDRARPTSC